ncbi:MAG: hypothetical protein SGARI_004070 [Bacillariaceae sp.]
MKLSVLFLGLAYTTSTNAFAPQLVTATSRAFSAISINIVPTTVTPATTLSASAAASEDTTAPTASENKSQFDAADLIFSVVDVDGSGALSFEELTNHLSTSGYTSEAIEQLFKKMDTDKNGEISRREFRRAFDMIVALQSAPGLGNYNAQFEKEIYEDADTLFRSCDENGDGKIELSELLSHMDRKFSTYSETALKKIFRSMDTDGDGSISKEEVRDAFVRCAALRQALGEGPNFK